MTNAQVVLIAAAILFAGGAIACAVGILAIATEGGPIPGLIAMIVGAVLAFRVRKEFGS